MRTKRNFFLLAALLLVSVAVWGVVGAQDATPETDTAQTTEARPFLGVLLEASDDGVVIAEVTEGSAAADAGLLAGDVITAVNGEAVTSASEVARAIQALAVGDEVTIDVTRDGEAVSVTATLGAQPGNVTVNTFPGLPFRRGNLDALQLGEMGIEFDAAAQTWTITSLSEDSALYEAGLREGDVITAIDGESYDQAGLLQHLFSLEDGATVTLNVTRDGEAQEIELPASDLTALFIPGGFSFGRNELPRGFRNMIPGMQAGVFANGWLGVSFTTLDADVAEANDLTVTDGALIKEVVEGSPAADAGLQVGDVVTAVNGEPVDAERTLRDRMIAYEAGDVVTLTILRDGETLEVEATLAEPQIQQFDMSQLGDLRGLFESGMPFSFGGRGDGNGGFRFEIPVPVQPEVPAVAGANL